MKEEIIGKQVKVIWEDGNKTQVREGKLLNFTESFITISSQGRKEMIPSRRIIRIEVKEK